jgi:hypothetical protein
MEGHTVILNDTGAFALTEMFPLHKKGHLCIQPGMKRGLEMFKPGDSMVILRWDPCGDFPEIRTSTDWLEY